VESALVKGASVTGEPHNAVRFGGWLSRTRIAAAPEHTLLPQSENHKPSDKSLRHRMELVPERTGQHAESMSENKRADPVSKLGTIVTLLPDVLDRMGCFGVNPTLLIEFTNRLSQPTIGICPQG